MNAAVFLDRDGTINEDRGYVYKKEDFILLPGAVEGMRLLQEAGFELIILTNQSGIARGYYTEEQYRELEQWMLEELAGYGVGIAGIYYCPHLPDAAVKKYAVSCGCRKPDIGMFQRAVGEHDIDLSRSFAIGDKMRDLSICKNGVTKGFLLYADQEKQEGNIRFLRGGILQAAAQIKKGAETNGTVDTGRDQGEGETSRFI